MDPIDDGFCHVHLWGTVEYEEALERQLQALEELKTEPTATQQLFLLEHPPIITVGRSGSARNILADPHRLASAGVRIVETSRGGDVTYHGPGQVVGYPVLRLDKHGKDVHRYLRQLESVLISTLADYGIGAGTFEGLTGVWVGPDKIASIGIAVSRWVSYHGFALNVQPNLEHFGLIRPCGLEGCTITSMKELLGCDFDMQEVKGAVARSFCRQFGLKSRNVDYDSLAPFQVRGSSDDI